MNKVILLPLGVTTDYLIEIQNGYMLVDTAYTKDYRRFRKELNKRNVRLEDIKYLFLTHHHDDHAGFAAQLLKETGAVLITHRRSVKPLSAGCSEENNEGYVTGRMKALFGLFLLFHHEFTFPPVNLRDGDILVDRDDENLLSSLGIDGKILMTPGHTYDSMSIVLDSGIAIVGDAAMNFMHFVGAAYRPIVHMDRAAVFHSWEKLFQQGVHTLYPAHGKPFKVEKLQRSFRRFA